VSWLLRGSLINILIWPFSLVFFGLLVWYRRKKRAELTWLRTLSEH
jgi:hypothetical protein